MFTFFASCWGKLTAALMSAILSFGFSVGAYIEPTTESADKYFDENIENGTTPMPAFGDGFNDISMIKFAGLGVAMANAQPVVKEAADEITLSNDEDGIAETLKRVVGL